MRQWGGGGLQSVEICRGEDSTVFVWDLEQMGYKSYGIDPIECCENNRLRTISISDFDKMGKQFMWKLCKCVKSLIVFFLKIVKLLSFD